MTHTIKNLKRGTVLVINGEPRELLGKPQKAIDGTYRVSYQCVTTGKGGACYLTAAQLVEISEVAR
jgi:hypothetical protein